MQVRFAPIDDSRLANLAPAHWHQRAESMRFERDRRCELVAGGLLAEMLGVSAEEVFIEMGEFGKPRLAGRPMLHFNLSHSGEYVMVVIAEEEVGCDIEQVVIEPDRDERFFEDWVMKEAKLKALGVGFVSEADEKTASKVKAALYPAPVGYRAAIATIGSDLL